MKDTMAQSLSLAPARIALCVAAMLALSGCIASEAPVLDHGQQPFGEAAKFQFYTLRDGAAHDPNMLQLRWDGARYTVTGPDFNKGNALTFHPLDGSDLVAQMIDGRPDHKVEYAVLRHVADGIYRINPVDENDADTVTRAKFCASSSACRVNTPEQVMGLARATAAKRHSSGALAIRIADDK